MSASCWRNWCESQTLCPCSILPPACACCSSLPVGASISCPQRGALLLHLPVQEAPKPRRSTKAGRQFISPCSSLWNALCRLLYWSQPILDHCRLADTKSYRSESYHWEVAQLPHLNQIRHCSSCQPKFIFLLHLFYQAKHNKRKITPKEMPQTLHCALCSCKLSLKNAPTSAPGCQDHLPLQEATVMLNVAQPTVASVNSFLMVHPFMK